MKKLYIALFIIGHIPLFSLQWPLDNVIIYKSFLQGSLLMELKSQSSEAEIYPFKEGVIIFYYNP
ncbi:MAG: hypothetical protein PF447_07875, partial [Spirochaetaceae bacterium]|nr:hypothetical protein [Spirochaetaceae bacterium]